MHIVRLNAENIKRLSAVEITPNGNLVEITGKNGQGKTSVLDAIYWALAGTKPIQGKPVRDGADTGSVTIDLGEYVVTRKFRVRDDGEYTTSLTVANKDGAKYSDPQKLLNALVGDLTFDPLDFSRMKPLDQVVALRALVPGYDFAEADRLNKKDFEARTDVNRDIRDLQARVEAITVPDGTPDERVDLAALMDELQKALDANEEARRHAERLSSHTAAIASLEDEIRRGRSDIARLQSDIAQIEKAIADKELGIEEYRDLIDNLGPTQTGVDTTGVRLRISESEMINRSVELKKQRRALNAELRAKTEESASLTGSISARKAAAAKAVREADLPVEGLELTEDSVLLNGVPFDQASDAEQLRVSIAVAGAMNPRLRVIRVRDGSLLDDDSMAALASYAEANGLQVWVETVQSGREAAIVIEDGHVATPATAEAAE
jgi:DNA repair exonuclease SbcCD ATPase subunit